jgi:hypothetical protein
MKSPSEAKEANNTILKKNLDASKGELAYVASFAIFFNLIWLPLA